MPITFVIKGLVAWLSALLYNHLVSSGKNSSAAVLLCGLIDIVIVAGGYCFCEIFLYGLGAALASVPSNIIQGARGLVISSLLYPVLKRPLASLATS